MKKYMSNKLLVAFGVLLMTIGFAAYSGLRLNHARAQFVQASEQLEDAQQFAGQIKHHRQTPRRITDQEIEVTYLARLIERAADQARVPRQSLDRIWPQPPRRISDTPYQRKATQLFVREITLAQAIGFLHGLTSSDLPLSIDAVRLSAPRNPPTVHSMATDMPELWTLETTVSHLLYQPASDSSSVTQGN